MDALKALTAGMGGWLGRGRPDGRVISLLVGARRRNHCANPEPIDVCQCGSRQPECGACVNSLA